MAAEAAPGYATVIHAMYNRGIVMVRIRVVSDVEIPSKTA